MDYTKIWVITATRKKQSEFLKTTMLGKCLSLYKSQNYFQIKVAIENKEGLPKIYNRFIEDSRHDPAILLFVHDDVFLNDYWWGQQILNAVNQFDLVGIVGNTQRQKAQLSWYHIVGENNTAEPDDPNNFSGVIGYGTKETPDFINFLGNPMQPVKLLDGCLLAAKSHIFHEHNIRFDERFDFHFYDVDICRQFEAKGLSMGTWPLSIVHKSKGSYPDAYKQAYNSYLAKWHEIP